jgi:hypothetical protein
MELGIVVPAYRPDVGRLRSYVQALADTFESAEIRVELDAPEPGVRDALADLPAVVNASPIRRGKGAAITHGFEALDADVLAFADGDGSTPPDSLSAVVSPLLAGEADLSVGSRRHPAAEVGSHQTYARRWLGDAFAWLARRLLDAKLYDYQCGAKAITRKAWKRVRSHLYEPGFAWDVELVAMAAALDLRLVEVPITWHDQPDSTVSPVSTSIEMGRNLLVSRHRAKLLADDALHSAIASYRDRPAALVDRPEPGETDD